jgi:hypothetical protein
MMSDYMYIHVNSWKNALKNNFIYKKGFLSNKMNSNHVHQDRPLKLLFEHFAHFL